MSTELTVRTESVLLDPSRFHQAVELAKVMAKADCMPAHLKGKPADCLRVVELAHRANQSPYAIADKTYFVGGKIAFEGQLCAALVNAHSSIEERLSYDYEGDEDKPATLKCVVSAKLKGEANPRTVRVTWIQGDAQSKGAKDKWQSQPAQQLAYYGARVWARRHTPEILLGMYTVDELEAGHIGPDHAREINPQTFGVARFATPAQVIDVEVPAPEPVRYHPETGEVEDDGTGTESPRGHMADEAHFEVAAGGTDVPPKQSELAASAAAALTDAPNLAALDSTWERIQKRADLKPKTLQRLEAVYLEAKAYFTGVPPSEVPGETYDADPDDTEAAIADLEAMANGDR